MKFSSPSRIRKISAAEPFCSMYRLMMASELLVSSAIADDWLVCSGRSVVAGRAQGLITMQLLNRHRRLWIGWDINATGFRIGWSLLAFGRSYSQIVVCFRSEYHWCFPPFFHPTERKAHCYHCYGLRPTSSAFFFRYSTGPVEARFPKALRKFSPSRIGM